MAQIRFRNLIISEDENHIFLNKPAGISTLEDRFSPINILQMAKTEYPGCQICHRLDKETSGVLLVARNSDTYKFVSKLFEVRKVKKIYHAVVDGLHDFKNFRNDKSLQQTGRGKSRTSNIGKESTTIFTTLDTYRYHSLVECVPMTGRTHQIRAHLQSMDASILGDREYGGKDVFLSQLKKRFNLKKFTEELPLIKRMALHAFSIEFKGINGVNHKVTAQYPKDFAVLLKSLAKYR